MWFDKDESVLRCIGKFPFSKIKAVIDLTYAVLKNKILPLL